MYNQDTFFQLSLLGQIGLTTLSLVLAFAVFFLTYIIFRKIRRINLIIDLIIRLGIAVTLFWVFLWWSPQIYYLYFQLLIDNLPWQIVITNPLSPNDLSRFLLFQNTNSLAHHSKAVLGWAMILYAIINALWRTRKPVV